jgi:putative transposase
MTRRWTFRAYPTETQAEHLAKTFGCCRLVYNGMLAARTAAFQHGERLTYAGTSAKLTVLKKDPELAFLNDVSCVPLQQSLRHLQTAFVNFFATRSAYPTFKKKNKTRDSAEYTRNGFRFNRASQRLTLAKLGVLELQVSRRVEVDPSTVTVTRHPSGRYYVSMVLEVASLSTKRVTTGCAIGIDFGLSRLATLSTGETIPNPRHLTQKSALLARAQRRLSGKQRGSNRYRAQHRRVARLHEQIADARRDSLHKLSTSLVRRFDTIFVEDLHLRGLVQNHHLARALSDASIGTAISMIEVKAEAAGVSVVTIDRWFPSSKQCSACGYLLDRLSLSVRHWTCPPCGTTHDRDINAARNILAVGQTVSARGGGVSAVRTSVRKAGRLRSVNHPGTKPATAP